MKSIINLKEFRIHATRYAERVKRGETFLVMKRSVPLFKVSPLGDDLWEEVIDFTEIKRGGIDIKDLLKRL